VRHVFDASEVVAGCTIIHASTTRAERLLSLEQYFLLIAYSVLPNPKPVSQARQGLWAMGTMKDLQAAAYLPLVC